MTIVKHYAHGRIFVIEESLAWDAWDSQLRGRLCARLQRILKDWQKIKPQPTNENTQRTGRSRR